MLIVLGVFGNSSYTLVCLVVKIGFIDVLRLGGFCLDCFVGTQLVWLGWWLGFVHVGAHARWLSLFCLLASPH